MHTDKLDREALIPTARCIACLQSGELDMLRSHSDPVPSTLYHKQKEDILRIGGPTGGPLWSLRTYRSLNTLWSFAARLTLRATQTLCTLRTRWSGSALRSRDAIFAPGHEQFPVDCAVEPRLMV